MAVRDREYLNAARALGASDLRIVTRHILPNIVQPLLVQAAIGMAGVMLAEVTLSLLDLGIRAQPQAGARCSTTPDRICFTPPPCALARCRGFPARFSASIS
jgi:ABC-type dipeptide/oligopeptide/nickel transport system permease subunit